MEWRLNSTALQMVVMGNNRDEKIIARMNFLCWGSMALQGLALVAIFVGLLTKGSKHHWGIWFSIGG